MLSVIAALAKNRVIGIGNRLPWRLPADLAHFKRLTLGKPVVMGRLTWESLGRPLPGRHNIVISRDPAYRAAGATVVGSLDAALAAAGAVLEVVVMGGASIYAQALPRADRLYLTVVDAAPAGDAWFPDYDPAAWRETEHAHRPADADNPHALDFHTYDRVRD